MNKTIEEYLDSHLNEKGLTLTKEQYQNAYKGIEYWLTTTLPDAVSDAVSNVEDVPTSIINVTYVSVWDGGTEIKTSAKYDIDTKEVFDIETVEGDGLDSLDEEYIELPNGDVLPVFEQNGLYATEKTEQAYVVAVDTMVSVRARSEEEALEKAKTRFQKEIADMDLTIEDVEDIYEPIAIKKDSLDEEYIELPSGIRLSINSRNGHLLAQKQIAEQIVFNGYYSHEDGGDELHPHTPETIALYQRGFTTYRGDLRDNEDTYNGVGFDENGAPLAEWWIAGNTKYFPIPDDEQNYATSQDQYGYIAEGEPTQAQIRLQDRIDNRIREFLSDLDGIYRQAIGAPELHVGWDISKITEVRKIVERELTLPHIY